MTEESTPTAPSGDVQVDPTRRQFFRRFAGEVVTSAAQVVGAVTELRDRSAAEAAALLDPDGVETSAAAATAAETEPPAPPTGFRTPFRFETDNVLLVIDQRKLPDELVEVPVRSGSDAASAIWSASSRSAAAIASPSGDSSPHAS